MKRLTVKGRWLALAAGVPLLAVLVLAAAEKPRPRQGGPPPWNCLDYRAEQMLFKAKTRLCVGRAEKGEMSRWLPAGDPHQPKPVEPAGGARLLKLEVKADLAGRLSEEEIFFEPEGGRVLQRTKIKLGTDPYRKSYRFGKTALEWTRSAPASREEADAGEKAWSKIENLSAPYPGGNRCRVYSEPVLLLYLVAAHDWTQPQGLELCFFASKTWGRIDASSIGLKPFAATYRKNGAEHKVAEARVIVLEASDAGPASDEPFELMGLRGDLEIYLDPESGLPLGIHGEMPWLGEVTVHLDNAELGGH